MKTDLRGPDGQYDLTIEVLCASGGQSFTRHSADQGVARGEGGGPPYLVLVDEVCSLVLLPGENGLTVQQLRLLKPGNAVVTATVSPGPGAPDWLPEESTYLLFRGSATDARGLSERYIPLAGMASERSWPSEQSTPLDRLAVAVGRSVARANAALARGTGAAGVALVSSVRIRVAVRQTEVSQGRVLVSLARPDQDGAADYVEFTMTTVPATADEEPG